MRWVGHLHLWVMGLVCLGMSPLYADGQYKITGVESADSLNIRAEPGAKSSVVAKAPHDGSGITLQGDSKWIGKTHWVKIAWQDYVGWVSKAYLQPMEETATKTDQTKADEVDHKADAPKSSAEVLTAMSPLDKTAETKTEASTAKAVSTTKAKETGVADKTGESPSKPTKSVQKEKISGMWILECGNISPFWKVDVLPEWISGTLGEHKTGMPITHKKQEHGKHRNIALKTEVRGANQWNRLELTLTYNKSCPSTLAHRRVAFDVTGSFNGEAITGCCRALQVE